jgi:hypothetical protein
MSANTLITSTVTGGTNSHTTTSEEANAIATDFVIDGVVGAITLNTGSGGTGSFCVNADGTPDMGVTIKSGQVYVTATPSSQDSQVLRVRATSDYTGFTINANSSGSTKYDWIYLKIDATNANDPAADASDVASIYTSRSSSNTTDNGTPPTYGLLLAVVTVANAASSITNSNISDKRFNTAIGAQNGSLIVQQQSSGSDAIVQSAGKDTNINLNLKAKGTGKVISTPSFSALAGIVLGGAITGTGVSDAISSYSASSTNTSCTGYYANIGGLKLCWGNTNSISVSGTGYQFVAAAVLLPSSFFSTVYSVNVNTSGVGNTEYMGVSGNSYNTSSIAFYVTQNGNGSNGNATISWLAIGK